MTQQYDHSETKNLSKDRSPNVLAAIKALENEGFYQGSDDINCEFKVITTHQEWEIKAGYSDVLLYLTVSLADGSRWLNDLEDCEEDFLPTNQQLIESHPKILEAQLSRIKQRKYERMMQAVAWVKNLVEPPRQPSPEIVLALSRNDFQYLGNREDYTKIDTGWEYLETYEANIGDWYLSCLWRDDDLIFLDAIHKETNQFWQKMLRKNDLAPHECFDSLKKIVRESA